MSHSYLDLSSNTPSPIPVLFLFLNLWIDLSTSVLDGGGTSSLFCKTNRVYVLRRSAYCR
uniref:Uncharacterized protein n=1 Tax=Megaselia scalaris TaxID=36166 RepID=T1GKM0_MEGSC